MRLIVGLGNPGSEYRDTRHNVGFSVLDRLSQRWGASFQQKFKGELGRATIAGEPSFLLKPLTFMNRSGISVALAREYFRVDVDDIIVVHDEIDLAFGRLRIKSGGGHAGHNGLRSLVASLGTRDFVRVRVGVGRPVHGDVSAYVLSRWGADEREWVPDLVERATDGVEEILRSGLKTAMNQFNVRDRDAQNPVK